ncbi:hypothetical protein [Oryzibacter oryziterrae]|uniref:hypothetical protein n=1 Tax=Oryzibacter oryziterrae TaxID=2766474 RepID=UPI001F438CE8|nr:hypothetical protein [Oryzibacter oryziterrae]
MIIFLVAVAIASGMSGAYMGAVATHQIRHLMPLKFQAEPDYRYQVLAYAFAGNIPLKVQRRFLLSQGLMCLTFTLGSVIAILAGSLAGTVVFSGGAVILIGTTLKGARLYQLNLRAVAKPAKLHEGRRQ